MIRSSANVIMLFQTFCSELYLFYNVSHLYPTYNSFFHSISFYLQHQVARVFYNEELVKSKT